MIEMFGPWITGLEKEYVMDAMNNWYGPKKYYYCERFEKEFASYIGRKYALMTCNCTSALHLILSALDIKNGEVIVPELTWIATTLGAYHLGNKIIFADIDLDDWCMSPKSLEKLITPQTKAIIVVDLYGNMPKMFELFNICLKRGIHFIEDSAEALGSGYFHIQAGNFGIASTFSFHRTKTLTTGEGGMLVTNEKDLYEQCKKLRDLGRSPGTYYNEVIGYKYMPFNIQAAIGLAQLHRIDKLIDKKRQILKRYQDNLKGFNIQFNMDNEDIYNGAWTTAIVTQKPIKISVSRPFFQPLSSLPAFNQKKQYKQINKNSYSLWQRGLNLPSAFNLTNEDIDKISEEIINEISPR